MSQPSCPTSAFSRQEGVVLICNILCLQVPTGLSQTTARMQGALIINTEPFAFNSSPYNLCDATSLPKPWGWACSWLYAAGRAPAQPQFAVELPVLKLCAVCCSSRFSDEDVGTEVFNSHRYGRNS